jgi:N-acetylmuramic acid 6-phosphate etherase
MACETHSTRPAMADLERPTELGLDGLLTEASRADLDEIDLASTDELVRLMNREDALVAAAVAAAAPQIVRAIDAIVPRFAGGGRLIYVGAGSAGRIGVLDASEAVPTFGTEPGRVVGVLAGGAAALTDAVEEVEDDHDAGARDLERLGLGTLDSVVGITASGRTPYVLEAIACARAQGALTIGVSSNPGARLSLLVDHPIEVVVGPEFIAGSTRLKAGTAQKLVLNTLSTVTMVRLGKTFRNLMVDVRATNDKLRVRAVRIVAQGAGVSEATAAIALTEADDDIRLAILTLLTGQGVAEARRRLEASGRNLREALRPGTEDEAT